MIEHSLPPEIEELLTLLEEIQLAEEGEFFEYIDDGINDD